MKSKINKSIIGLIGFCLARSGFFGGNFMCVGYNSPGYKGTGPIVGFTITRSIFFDIVVLKYSYRSIDEKEHVKKLGPINIHISL